MAEIYAVRVHLQPTQIVGPKRKLNRIYREVLGMPGAPSVVFAKLPDGTEVALGIVTSVEMRKLLP
jgi:hypothetical protein